MIWLPTGNNGVRRFVFWWQGISEHPCWDSISFICLNSKKYINSLTKGTVSKFAFDFIIQGNLGWRIREHWGPRDLSNTTFNPDWSHLVLHFTHSHHLRSPWIEAAELNMLVWGRTGEGTLVPRVRFYTPGMGSVFQPGNHYKQPPRNPILTIQHIY